MRLLYAFFVLFSTSLALLAQSPESNRSDGRIQLSGRVLDGSSDQWAAIPGANIYLPGTKRGTYSDSTGFFSILVHRGETVRFSAVGFESAILILPDSLSGGRHSIVQLLSQETVNLATAVIYPWLSREHFKLEFLEMDVSNKLALSAQANLTEERLARASKALPPDGNEATDFHFRQQAQRNYYGNQIPPATIFSPIEWRQFLKTWKD